MARKMSAAELQGTRMRSSARTPGRMNRTVMQILLLIMVIGLTIAVMDPALTRPVSILMGLALLLSGLFSFYTSRGKAGKGERKMGMETVMPIVMILLGSMILGTQLLT